MADHVVIQVRDAIIAALQGQGSGLSSANVFASKGRPKDISIVPYLYVEYEDDQAERESLGFPSLEQLETTYSIVIVVAQTGDYEKAAFLLRNQVELALLGTVSAMTLGGKVQLMTRTQARKEVDETATKPVYSLTLTVVARIRHQESLPDTLQ